MGQIEQFDFVGGHLALDFANTLGGVREGPWDDEWLHSDADVARWAELAGLGASDPVPVEDARALRSAIYDVFAPLAAGTAPPGPALDALARFERAALEHARLTAHGWEWTDASPLWPVADAAVQLLRDPTIDRLKQCAHCRWLYLDASRNRSRRWCSMEHCGTEAKIRRRRERAR